MKVKKLFREVQYPIRLYNEQGKRIYYEDMNGFWLKKEYNDQGKEIYFENSVGFWIKREYNEQGKEIYIEYNSGYIEDNRPKSKTKTIIIDGKEITLSQESFKQLKESLGA